MKGWEGSMANEREDRGQAWGVFIPLGLGSEGLEKITPRACYWFGKDNVGMKYLDSPCK